MNSDELKLKIEKLKNAGAGGLASLLGIKLVEVNADLVKAEMMISEVHHQPFGIMHGGVSLALAETVASVGGCLNIHNNQNVVGLELNANHIKSVRSGLLSAEARPAHLGQRTHVWMVQIYSENKLICLARCTLLVLDDEK